MWLYVGLCILAIAEASPSDEAPRDVATIFSCNFGEASDSDFNDWPDRWTRRQGPGFPQYVKAKLDFDAIDDTHGLLRIDVDGAGAEVISPPVTIDGLHTYAVEASIKTSALVNDRARVTLTLLDARRQPLGSWHSEPLTGTANWTPVRIAPVNVAAGEPHYAQVSLAVEAGNPAGLTGTAWFRELRLLQLPRLRLEPSRALTLYDKPHDCAITIHATGLRHPAQTIGVQVSDHAGLLVLDDRLTPEWKPTDDHAEPGQSEVQTELHYQPRLPHGGHFRVRATLRTDTDHLLVAECPLTIARPLPRVGGQFGFSLSERPAQLGDAAIAELVTASALGRVKLPLWQSVGEAPSAQSPDQLVQLLSARGTRCIGVISTPPATVQERLPEVDLTAIADILAQPSEIWFASLQAMFLRYGLEVRDWQLGRDQDRSFVGYPQLVEHLQAIKRQLDVDGEAFGFGIAWDWTEAFPHVQPCPVSFLAMSAQPPLTAREAPAYIDVTDRAVPERWAQIEPAWLASQAPADRPRALAQWMIGAATAGASQIFLVDPFAHEGGLFDAQGRPNALFLPWRTTAHALAGAKYAGELTLPAGSANRLFVRGREAVLVVWAESSRSETLSLGERLSACDVYGNMLPLSQRADGLQVTVGPEPCFITGISADVARWHLAMQFAQRSIPSMPGVPFEQSLRITNPFDIVASGRLRLIAPKDWIVVPNRFSFEIPPGETIEQTLAITLRYGALSGPQPVTIQCELTADHPYQFDVPRILEVGEGDVLIEIDSQLTGEGLLEVESLLVNNTGQPLRFLCSLYATGRRRQQFEVVSPPLSQTPVTCRIPAGRELIGETLWLQANEIGTDRVLNYRFVARP